MRVSCPDISERGTAVLLLAVYAEVRKDCSSLTCAHQGKCALFLVNGLSGCIPEAEGFADDSPCFGIAQTSINLL